MSELTQRRSRAASPVPRKQEGTEDNDDKKTSAQKLDDSTLPRELQHVKLHWVEMLCTLALVALTPITCLTFGFITCSPELSSPTLSGFLEFGSKSGVLGTLRSILALTGLGSSQAWQFLLVFNLLALALYWIPGATKYGPITPKGHTPAYIDNGIAHCVLFTLVFLVTGPVLGLFPAGIFFDVFPGLIGALNIFGLAFCLFLYIKGLRFPSTPDCGSSGNGFLFDYYWGTELYPRIAGVDVKRFVNCRFSMTFWMLAGISYAFKSYELHGVVDPGVVFAALSQFLYLCKFFAWEIGYMRSIDIIVDRAGFYETWGCLTWVPAVYTLHTRLLVRSPSGLSWPVASVIFAVGISGVFLNYWADAQRMRFREAGGNCLVWGKKPDFIRAKYSALDEKTGKVEVHESLLLACGWWGVARHFQYLFELIAAWSWGLLGGVATNGFLPLFYPIFLTILLIHRAGRDEEKCLAKYGDYYREYMKKVRFRIIPFVY